MVTPTVPGSTSGAIKRNGGAGIGVGSGGARAELIEIDGFILALAGHPRLGSSERSSTDPRAIAMHLRTQGPGAIASIGGDFALAAWDAAKASGLLAIDRIGVHQLVYGQTNEAFAFASTLDLLVKHPGVSSDLLPQAIFDYLYFHVCPGPETIYRDLRRLPPGHLIEFGSGGAGVPRPYWSMRFDERHDQGFPALKQRFVDLLEHCVATAADDVPSGAFLSGGTDSSTVSGMLGRTRGQRPRTFSIGFDATGYDEMEYARIAARHFDSDHHEYYVTPADVVAAVPVIARHYDQPFGNASAVPAYYCARLARDSGVQRLLAGDGGDELFGGNERYSKQHLLGLYHRAPARLRKLVVEPLVLSTPLFKSVPGLRKVYSYVEQAHLEMPARYESRNLLDYLGVEQMLTNDFLAAVDRGNPHRLMRETHAAYADCSLINQMLGIDLRFTLADSDLPKVTRMCELAGVDVAFPLLDERLVEFSALLPAEMKLRGTYLRWFFKQALRDFLPPAVISKQKHGFGLPVGTWLIEHAPLRTLAGQAIDSLRPHRIVRTEFVDALMKQRLHEHPRFFGTMVWVLMMLGLWLDSRRT
ncbi:MAG TPA: asparagine synthase-related protein [Burkholderiaceae bacterium]|nr:asparagine synthase-related protein [Burkholderiaceae bacterium]